MERQLTKKDIVLDDIRFLRLGFEQENKADMKPLIERYRFDHDRALDMLMKNPALGVEFLAAVRGDGPVIWCGPGSGDVVFGRSLGVRVTRSRGEVTVSGDNSFGDFLTILRDRYRKYLGSAVIEELPVREGQVIVDYTRPGAVSSDIEEREDAGERFIHVDVYRPAKFRHDTGFDGTSGHASRRSDADVYFQRFVCPFGTSYPSPIIVESEAEASFLYERAIRGELDWKALFSGLAARGLFAKNLTARQLGLMADEYRAQFSWVREQVMTNPELKDMRIVAPSMLVSDASLGRSVFDGAAAPSPAHVLARYINNPVLLQAGRQTHTENGVFRALSDENRSEAERFVLDSGDGAPLTLAVIGSDTIGGREPGRRAVQKSVRKTSVLPDGRRVITTSKRYEIPMKTKEETEKDYVAFSARMDSVLAGVAPGHPVRLVSGNVSSLSTGVGVGTPRMVERYVLERGGTSLQWDYSRNSAFDRKARRPERTVECPHKLEAVLMEHFYEALPVLAGRTNGVSFLLDGADPDSGVALTVAGARKAGIAVDGGVCFSVGEDQNNRNVLALGSLVAGEGLPLIHVQENAGEDEQRRSLRTGAVLSRASLSGDITERGVLFDGELRVEWSLDGVNNLSHLNPDTHEAVPFVFSLYPAPAVVAGYEFRSVFAAYTALVARETGKDDRDTFLGIASADGDMKSLMGIYGSLVRDAALPAEAQERLLRQSVRLMAEADAPFSEMLLALDDRDIVMPVNGEDGTGLFVGLDGRGQNRFGMVLASERERMAELQRARLESETKEREKALQEAARRQRLAVGAKAEGQKVSTGLPASLNDAKDAVWFLGTNTPDALVMPDGRHSFDMWDDMGGSDPLVREKAGRPWVDDGAGGRIDNDYIYIFPSDLAAVTGARRVVNRADSRDLTGVMRKDPATGEEYCCAFGIPVRFNNRGNELVNNDNYPCSYRLDNDASNYAESLVLADSQARSAAIRRDLSLSLPGRYRRDGSAYYTLPQVFMAKTYGAVREEYTTPDGRKDTRTVKKWTDNPHRSALNEMLTDRYVSMLENGRDYPLNLVRLPADSYGLDDTEVNGRTISAEGRFVSDLLLSLRIANSTALALGVPLRFPLDSEGRIDLGPGVPEHFRALAERRIDSFIGVVNKEDISTGPLPYLERVSMYEAARSRDSMERSGTDVYLRPNDLVFAFGQYDFSAILAEQPAPLHEMAFRTADGNVFLLVDAKSTRGMDLSTVNEYLSYGRNDERRFVVKATDVSRVPAFVSALKSYAERAKAVTVETRLVRESELGGKDRSMKGFVNLLSSNSLGYAISEHDIGREMTFANGASRFDGVEAEQAYWGHVDSADGFAGYAELRWTLPDGTRSEWTPVEDLELAKDLVMSAVGRTYRSDTRVVPSESVLNMLSTAYAVGLAGDTFRTMEFRSARKVQVDDKVVSLPSLSGDEAAKEAEVVKESVSQAKDNPSPEPVIVFTESSGGYAQRTRENANADDVDFTLAFAIDFSTAGEKCTAAAAGDSLIAVSVPLKENGGVNLTAKAIKAAVDELSASLPDEFLSGEPFGLNVAGNGLYTLARSGVTQEQADEFVTRVLAGLRERGAVISSIRSGGQTGIDESGIVAAKVLGIPATVRAPKGWMMRGADGIDVSGEDMFRRRFEVKDYAALSEMVKRPGRKQEPGIRM